jgi:uncharacterized protein
MRILITGASGMIGSAVSDALLARGDEVVGLTRDPARARETNPTVRWHSWNPTLERPPGEALEGVDGVINLVGESLNQRWTEEAKKRIIESRERATRNLVHSIAAAKPRPATLVSQAAIGFYGDRGDAIIDESAEPGTGFDSAVVVAWAAAAHEAERADVRTVITRTGLVLDPEGGLLKQLLLPFRAGVGGPIASGRQYMSWIHRDDEVALLLWALDRGESSGVYNATSPNPVTNREFAKTLGRVLRRPAIVPVPKAALQAIYGGQFADAVTGGQRVIPRRALDEGFGFRFPDLEPALRDLLER